MLGAVFACVCAAKASAAEIEWRQGGAALTSAVAVKSSGNFILQDRGRSAGTLTLECKYEGAGTAGPGVAGKETSFSFTTCSVTHPAGECEGALTQEIQHLPWKTELVVTKGTAYDLISSGGTGAPGIKLTCTHLGSPGWVVDECSGTLKTTVKDKTTGVETEYDVEEGEPLKCSWKGTASTSGGLVNGVGLVQANSGAALEVVRSENWERERKALTGSVATKTTGSVKLTDESLSVECKDTGEGSAGTGGSDELSKLTLSACTFVSSGSCEAGVAPLITAGHLSWHSELLWSPGAAQRSHDVSVSGGKGAPVLSIECRVSGVMKVVDECTATSVRMSATNVTGGVEGSFDGEKLTCSATKAATGKLEGTQLIAATSGSALEVEVP
ncbi:MAG TPA: hypothetical protein VK691_03455 [Solirubrobacteraceae bacterium]|nr:hypothetical protein [Solirubrobacteraceae bacterium]